jgi:hypothetical protein
MLRRKVDIHFSEAAHFINHFDGAFDVHGDGEWVVERHVKCDIQGEFTLKHWAQRHQECSS